MPESSTVGGIRPEWDVPEICYRLLGQGSRGATLGRFPTHPENFSKAFAARSSASRSVNGGFEPDGWRGDVREQRVCGVWSWPVVVPGADRSKVVARCDEGVAQQVGCEPHEAVLSSVECFEAFVSLLPEDAFDVGAARGSWWRDDAIEDPPPSVATATNVEILSGGQPEEFSPWV